ncbi:MAG: response regulator transcription factor [Acidobacteriia bacterium]|nr:response regulator transcription factor [Terriglobia bacterium]
MKLDGRRQLPEARIRVLLVDDHALVRLGFRRLLEDDPALEVVGEASDGQEAVELARRLRPDVVVMDYAIPGFNGALATRKIREAVPGTRVLMLSMHSEPSYVTNSREAGASGYLLKNALDLELVAAVKGVLESDWLQDPRLEHESFSTGAKRSLSKRELEVLALIVAGRSNKEIAGELSLSVNTVAVHRANIMDALNLHNAAELVVYAIRHGLVSLP